MPEFEFVNIGLNFGPKTTNHIRTFPIETIISRDFNYYSTANRILRKDLLS